MMFGVKAALFVGQFWRKHTHLKYFRKATMEPRLYQERKLLQIIRANQDTEFGRRFDFRRINSIEDFQARVPASDYEQLLPYIEAAMQGEPAQLTAESPFMFATTSGTTAKPKFIPITRSHLKDYTHAFQIHNYKMIEDYSGFADGKFLIVSSNDEEGRVPSGVPYGAVSGVLNRQQPDIIRRHFATPYELGKIKNVETKYYLMLRLALACDLTSILCCNPSSLMLIADQMEVQSAGLVADIFDGRVDSNHRPPERLASAFEPFLKPRPERARELTRILEKKGKLTPELAWPRLGLLSCWKGGPMSFYLDRLAESYGRVPVRDFGYMASEGRGSIPLSDQGAGGVLALTSHFFEFVDQECSESNNKEFLTADQLKKGRRYFIYFTTSAGLYRYNINDIVEVVGFYNNTPVIEFVRKGGGISSITGEKLTEEQVRVALQSAIDDQGLQNLKHFTAAVRLEHPPYYQLFAEAKGEIPTGVQGRFVDAFEQSLRKQNTEYDDKRQSRRLAHPRLEILPEGTYLRLRQKRVLDGAPEAQVKIPLLSGLNQFGEQLGELGVEVREKAGAGSE